MKAQPPGAWSETASVADRSVTVHTVPLGSARLVLATTGDGGVLGCGAVDPGALERLQIPAARVRPGRGASITDFDDLCAGVVSEANGAAQARGVTTSMTGREALEHL